jgi:DNA polymerase-3 subunit delta
MSPSELLADVGKGKFRPAYYFHGTEDYRIIEAEKYLARQFLPDRQLLTSYRRIDGRKASFAEISAELCAYPMLGERLVVSVSDIQKFGADDIERLGKLLMPPDPNRLVIFSTPSARAPRKDAAILKRIGNIAETVEFRKLTFDETRNQISRNLTKAGLTIEPKALQLFAEAVAGNRGAIENETEKMAAYKEPGSVVSVDDVRRMVGGYEVFVIYELANDIVRGDAVRVLRQIRSLIADGNGPTGILFWISKHFIELYLVKNGKPLESKRRWLAWKYREQTGRLDNDRLERIIIAAAEADASMRLGKNPPNIILEMLAVQLVQP